MIKLMIVDDSNVIRTRIENAYSDNQSVKVVGKAVNGRQAIVMAEMLQPEIVTMDLTMPSMDGVECIEQLVELIPEIKILVVSALSDKSTGIKALSMGAHGFLCKPFTDESLRSALQQIIDIS